MIILVVIDQKKVNRIKMKKKILVNNLLKVDHQGFGPLKNIEELKISDLIIIIFLIINVTIIITYALQCEDNTFI